MNKEPHNRASGATNPDELDQATRDSIRRSDELARMALEREEFPTFRSLTEAEAYSDQRNDAYFEICYHLEGSLNLSRQTIHDLYSSSTKSRRAKMQTGVVRENICPEGWPKHPKTLVVTLLTCARFRHEATCDAFLVGEAMAALVLEKEHEGTLNNAAYHRQTLQPWSEPDAHHAREDLLRLCDWMESRLHWLTHQVWYRAPDCFSDDPDKVHLANIGLAQRYLGNLSPRDCKRWEEIHRRAAAKYQEDLRKWSTVGKVQYDPEPRTWTHPDVDVLVIGLWPLVTRYNWTYTDLLNVLNHLLPASPDTEVRYPLDSAESLKVHCRAICGLTKTGKGRTANGLPDGWKIAHQLFRPSKSAP